MRGLSKVTYGGVFDNIDHKVLMDILSRDIHDGRLLNLIRMALEAGYLEHWVYHKTYSGAPQGGVLSPLLANIYLNELDAFVEDELIPQYTRGQKRARNPAYQRVSSRIKLARRRGDHEAVQALQKQQRQLPSGDPHDPHFRRLKYVRYADDFILGFIGPKSEAKAIKAAISEFLCNRLHLEMSETKTLITHARTQHAHFLGYAISIYQVDDALSRGGRTGAKGRRINGKIRLGVPYGLTTRLVKPYQRNRKVVGEPGLLMFSDAHIINVYQTRFRGLAEYYKYAVDRSTLGRLQYVMEVALTKMLAEKYRTSVRRIYRKYRGTRTVDDWTYKTLEVEVPTPNGKHLFYWGAIPLRVVKPGSEPVYDTRPNERKSERADLIRRLQADRCELCGSQEKCEVHHVRKLSDLKKRWAGRREKPKWVKQMIAIQRKTLVVCYKCHKDIHAGKPTPTRRKT